MSSREVFGRPRRALFWCDTNENGLRDGHTEQLRFDGDEADTSIAGYVYVLGVDLDIDSDNTGGPTAPPDRTPDEEQIEDIADDPDHPGKILGVNDGDTDADGIADYVDLVNPAQWPPTAASELQAGAALTPVILDLEAIPAESRATARVHVDYADASNPLEILRSGDAQSGYTYTPAAGKMRLWRNRDGSQNRRMGNVTQDGHYVAPGIYTGQQLRVNQSSAMVVLYLEGIEPSQTVADARIEVTVDLDGDGPIPALRPDAVRATISGVALAPNYDRDPDIDREDRGKAAAGEVYYFWTNNDDDKAADEGIDQPGGGLTGREDWRDNIPFLGQYVVDSVRDFVDFFPVWVGVRAALAIYPVSEYDYVLKHSDGAFNAFIPTGLTPDQADAHLFDSDYCEAHADEVLHPITADGYSLPEEFLNAVVAADQSLILLEARAATCQPLVLEVRRRSDGGLVEYALFPISIASVETMYRHKNLRSVTGGSGGEPNRLGEPLNYPDALTNGRNVIYIHGYNVNATDAYAAQCEVFKRIYWSGSNAKFHGITWNGDQTQLPILEVTPNYHKNVMNALNTASAVKDYITATALDGDVVVIAHSLGNMLASAAICLHGANVKGYMIVDGAVAMEAFKADQAKEWDMVHSDWDNYYFDNRTNDFLFASEWHELFVSDSSDPRRKLTWRGIFANAGGTQRFNFYTPGEDVVKNTPHDKGDDVFHALEGYAWGVQEKLKGRMPLGQVAGSRYAGWGFNQDDYGNGWPDPFWEPEPPEDAYQIPPQDLETEPFFYNSPSDLFSTNETTARDYAYHNYYELLAKAFPARTFGIAANPIDGSVMQSYDMQANRNGWYSTELKKKYWGHSSFIGAAYLYTHPMYKEMVKKGLLK